MPQLKGDNKINGMKIARAQASFMTLPADGKKDETCYVVQKFSYTVDESYLNQNSISDEMVNSCIDELEELGSFEEVMKDNAVDLKFASDSQTGSGYKTPGVVVACPDCPQLVMVVTPLSVDNSSVDCIFEWFFDVNKTGDETKV